MTFHPPHRPASALHKRLIEDMTLRGFTAVNGIAGACARDLCQAANPKAVSS